MRWKSIIYFYSFALIVTVMIGYHQLSILNDASKQIQNTLIQSDIVSDENTFKEQKALMNIWTSRKKRSNLPPCLTLVSETNNYSGVISNEEWIKSYFYKL